MSSGKDFLKGGFDFTKDMTAEVGGIFGGDVKRLISGDRKKRSKRSIGDVLESFKDKQNAKPLENILGDIKKSDAIDELTRQDILALGAGGAAGSTKRLADVNKMFAEAKEGISPKFKSRMATQMLFNTTVDQADSSRLRGQLMNFGSTIRK